MTNKNDWLVRKTPRSVEALRLWPENPRLDPEEDYHNFSEIAEAFISTESDRADLIALAKSIQEKGFIAADPVVVWQDDNTKAYFVAEGNRRVLVLKLLKKPTQAPKSIRNAMIKLSAITDKEAINKIPVSVAPTLEDAEWYISQRNSLSSLQKRWTAEQQRRWVAELYEKYKGDVEKVGSRTDMTESELQDVICILKVKGMVHEVKESLSEEEYEKAKSVRFPITTLERFFTSRPVKEKWGLYFDDYNVIVKSERSSFLSAYAIVIKRMLLPEGNSMKIDSRTTGNNKQIEGILETLPIVVFPNVELEPNLNENIEENEDSSNIDSSIDSPTQNDNAPPGPVPIPQPTPKKKDDPYRARLIDSSYYIQTDQWRMNGIFNELKDMPLKYTNAVAASIRILLDLSVLNYLTRESLITDIQADQRKGLREIQLSNRLEFIKKRLTNTKAVGIIGKLLNPINLYSLDVLNGYQHNNDTHCLAKDFLNRFWDFLLPLFMELIEIKEEDV